jgi:signal transduction histidine kinase
MEKGIKKPESMFLRKEDQSFIQPLAVALVCIVFISLVLVMGLADLRNLDNTFVNDMENRGLAIIRNFQRVAENHFKRLVQSQQADLYTETIPGFSEDAFSLQESLVIRLVELARNIDSLWETGKSGDAQLVSFATEENLRLIAFLDEQGNVIAKNRPVPQGVVQFAAPVINGREEIQINIFDQFKIERGLGLIALPLKSRKGTIIMALDNNGFRYWSLKICIQRAIEEVGEGPGISHITVTDKSGRTMGHSDTEVEDREETTPIKSKVGDSVGVASRKTIIGGKHVLEIEVPVVFTAGFTGLTRLGLSRERVDRLLKKEQIRVFIYMAFLVIIAFLAMWLLYKNQNRHLARMREIERQLHQAEKLSALGRLAAGVAHEIRNPLNAISMASQRLQRDNLSQLSEVIRDEIRRLNKIIEDFLTFSKNRELEFRSQDLIELVRQIILLISEEAESRGVKIVTHLANSAFMVSMDFDRLKQALFNIIKNAIESISDEGLITISVETEGKQWVNVRVSDTGNGLNPDETGRIFDPDYTTKEKGLGLGLPLAHEIIRGHGGEIRVRSKKGSGTTFEILLPKIT